MADSKKEDKKEEVIGWFRKINVTLWVPILITLGLIFVFGLSIGFWVCTTMLWVIFVLELVYSGSEWPRRLAKLTSAFLLLVILNASVGDFLWRAFEARCPAIASVLPAYLFDKQVRIAREARPVMTKARAMLVEQLKRDEEEATKKVAALLKEGKTDEAIKLIEAAEKANGKIGDVFKETGVDKGVKSLSTVELRKGEVREITLDPNETSTWMKLSLGATEVARYNVHTEGERTGDIIYGDGDIVHIGQPIPGKTNPIFAVKNTWQKKQVIRITVM